jgi:membrane protease YdiL (CAAX protease family)
MNLTLGPRAAALAIAYAAVWAAAVAFLAVAGADWTFPLISMGVFGLALSGVALVLTRNAKAPPVPVQRPALEAGAVLAFLALYAVVFLGWGMGAVRAVFPPGREQELLVLAVKLAVHVALPAALLAALGARLAPLFAARIGKPGFWPTLIVLGAILIGLLCVVSPSLKQIADTHAPLAVLAWAAPASFVWMAVEAGFCEEFLFRAVLQSRLAAALKTEVGAVVLGATLFGLAHAPGLYLRGGPDVDGWSTNPLQVAAYTIATLSPLALLMGTVWARTRSLLLVVLLHASVDVLPNLPEFLHTWAL